MLGGSAGTAAAALAALLRANLLGLMLCSPMGSRDATSILAGRRVYTPYAQAHVCAWRVTPEIADYVAVFHDEYGTD